MILKMFSDASALREALATLATAPVLSVDQARGDPTSQAAALKEVSLTALTTERAREMNLRLLLVFRT